MSIEPIDTSTLGPIRVDQDAEAHRAKLVSDALNRLTSELADKGFHDQATHLSLFTGYAPAWALAMLGRLLK